MIESSLEVQAGNVLFDVMVMSRGVLVSPGEYVTVEVPWQVTQPGVADAAVAFSPMKSTRASAPPIDSVTRRSAHRIARGFTICTLNHLIQRSGGARNEARVNLIYSLRVFHAKPPLICTWQPGGRSLRAAGIDGRGLTCLKHDDFVGEDIERVLGRMSRPMD